MPKKIGKSDIIGERGVTYVRGVVLNMGFMFYETGGVEAGIDGTIELRDEDSGVVRNLGLQVQVKSTTRRFAAETDTSFEFACKEDDITYWREGTAPVLLIVVRPDDGVAYWKSIKEWFADTDSLRTRKIVFDKAKDLFSKETKSALIEVASSASPGSIPSSVRIEEYLIPNLVRVEFYPKIYWAPTKFNDNKAFGAALREIDDRAPSEWVVKGHSLISFHNLDQHPWNKLSDAGAMEEFDVEEWSETEDEDKSRDFVQLLNRALSSFVAPDLRFDRQENHYYFVKRKEQRDVKYGYGSTSRWTTRKVVGRYGRKKDASSTAYYRHSAFWGRFVRYDRKWYLEVNPTYRFTSNGKDQSLYSADSLKGIKERENNAAVIGQFIMWRYFLTNRGGGDLYKDRYPFISFVSVPDLILPYGVPDELWRSREAGPTSPLFDASKADA